MSFNPPRRNAPYVFYISLVQRANTCLLQTNPTIAVGDFQVAKDGGALASLATLPLVLPINSRLVRVALSASEMDAENVTVVASDVSGAQWCDLVLNIQPVGDAGTAAPLAPPALTLDWVPTRDRVKPLVLSNARSLPWISRRTWFGGESPAYVKSPTEWRTRNVIGYWQGAGNYSAEGTTTVFTEQHSEKPPYENIPNEADMGVIKFDFGSPAPGSRPSGTSSTKRLGRRREDLANRGVLVNINGTSMKAYGAFWYRAPDDTQVGKTLRVAITKDGPMYWDGASSQPETEPRFTPDDSITLTSDWQYYQSPEFDINAAGNASYACMVSVISDNVSGAAQRVLVANFGPQPGQKNVSPLDFDSVALIHDSFGLYCGKSQRYVAPYSDLMTGIVKAGGATVADPGGSNLTPDTHRPKNYRRVVLPSGSSIGWDNLNFEDQSAATGTSSPAPDVPPAIWGRVYIKKDGANAYPAAGELQMVVSFVGGNALTLSGNYVAEDAAGAGAGKFWPSATERMWVCRVDTRTSTSKIANVRLKNVSGGTRQFLATRLTWEREEFIEARETGFYSRILPPETLGSSRDVGMTVPELAYASDFISTVRGAVAMRVYLAHDPKASEGRGSHWQSPPGSFAPGAQFKLLDAGPMGSSNKALVIKFLDANDGGGMKLRMYLAADNLQTSEVQIPVNAGDYPAFEAIDVAFWWENGRIQGYLINGEVGTIAPTTQFPGQTWDWTSSDGGLFPMADRDYTLSAEGFLYAMMTTKFAGDETLPSDQRAEKLRAWFTTLPGRP